MSVEIKKSICMWCHNHCRVDVHTSSGQLLKIEADREHPLYGELHRVVSACAKARSALDWYYHQDRLNFPLKRAGEKGEGRWQVISWEQAMEEISSKLIKLRDKYGPETLATSSGTGRTHDEYRSRFMNLFGTPNNIGQGQICYGPGMMACGALAGWPYYYPAVRPGKTMCLFMIGTNPEQQSRRLWYAILEAQKLGAKLIVVDPRRTVTAERADLFLQPRPGTDGALLLGMINLIIKEGLYDREFVQKWGHGFDKFASRAAEYPLEKVAEITWVPAEKIAQAARMYATIKPAHIIHGMGLEHLANSIEILHARYSLTALTGNIDLKGGELMRGHHPSILSEYEIEMNDAMPEGQKKKQIGIDKFRLQSWVGYDMVRKNTEKVHGGMFSRYHCVFGHTPEVYRAMFTGKPYPVRALFTMASNPMVTQANTKMVHKAIKSLDLYVVLEYWKTPSAELADYLLPGATWLERPNIFNWWEAVNFIEGAEIALPPKVEGKWDRWCDYDFFRDLGIRLGQGKYWPWKTLEEAYDYRLSPLEISFKEFMKSKTGLDRPVYEEKKYQKIGFATQTGKFEFYSTVLERLGYDPLPQYYEPPESPISQPELAKQYPLLLITGGRHLPFFHSEHRQVDAIRKEHPDPIFQMHPDKAAELGISDGDWVWIETLRGRCRQKCQLTTALNPRVVHAQHGWWFPELPGEEPWLHGAFESNINVCTDDEFAHSNKINGGWPLRAELCRVSRAKTF